MGTRGARAVVLRRAEAAAARPGPGADSVPGGADAALWACGSGAARLGAERRSPRGSPLAAATMQAESGIVPDFEVGEEFHEEPKTYYELKSQPLKSRWAAAAGPRRTRCPGVDRGLGEGNGLGAAAINGTGGERPAEQRVKSSH